MTEHQKAEFLKAPCKVTQTFGSCFAQDEAGNHIYYTVFQGDPSCLFVYHIDERRILDQQPLLDDRGNSAEHGGCSVDLGPDGTICITGGSFFTYQPAQKKLRYYGRIFEEDATITKGDFDQEGNYYFGTYPNACLVKYDRQADCLVKVKHGVVEGNYARAVAVYQNKVFVGGLGCPYDAPFVKYDLDTHQTTKIAFPKFENNESHQYKSVYSISRISEKLICMRVLGDRYLSMIFDMEQETFLDVFEGINYIYSSALHDNKTYYIWNNQIASRDIVKKETQVYGGRLPNGMHCVAPTVTELKDQKKYPGKSLLLDSTCNGIFIFNFETQAHEYISDSFPAAPIEMRMIRNGPQDIILCSAMRGAHLYAYDVKKDTIRKAVGAQKEDICVIDGKCYFGGYGNGGTLTEWDLSKPDQPGVNPREVSSMEGTAVKQDRIFVITEAGDSIAYGSVPYYGGLGGALALYHKATGKTKLFENIVKNQSVTGLAYRDGKLYGCTDIFGGLGSKPIDDHAKLFVFDMKTETVEQVKDIIIDTEAGKQYIAGQMTWSRDGRLFAGTLNHLIEIEPETLEIKAVLKLGNLPQLTTSDFRWQGAYFRWQSEDVLVTNVGRVLHLVDIRTWKAEKLCEDTCQSFAMGSDGTFYIHPIADSGIYQFKR